MFLYDMGKFCAGYCVSILNNPTQYFEHRSKERFHCSMEKLHGVGVCNIKDSSDITFCVGGA